MGAAVGLGDDFGIFVDATAFGAVAAWIGGGADDEDAASS